MGVVGMQFLDSRLVLDHQEDNYHAMLSHRVDEKGTVSTSFRRMGVMGVMDVMDVMDVMVVLVVVEVHIPLQQQIVHAPNQQSNGDNHWDHHPFEVLTTLIVVASTMMVHRLRGYCYYLS